MNQIEKRHAFILETLSQKGKIEVAKLSKLCQVSLVTIRKDLSTLENKNLLRREQGYALTNESDEIQKRIMTNHLVKRQIAKVACSLINDGDTIMIESGSCCILLAEEICKTKNYVTIITNSVFMANYLNDKPNLHLVLLGGDYQQSSQAVTGPITHMCAKAFHVNKFFVGTDGYQADTCFTGDNLVRVETLRNMAGSADEIIMITESMKFKKPGIVSLFTLNEVTQLITDEEIPDEIRQTLETHQIQVHTAS